MSQPFASVVIPSYNHAAFIEEALASVLDSGSADLDVVVVDDGSRDDTLERLAPLRKDPRLRVFTQANRGADAAFNRAMELSRGEILFLLNSDDACHPERIARCLERFAQNPDLVIVSSWIDVVDESGRSLGIKEGFRNMPPWPRRRPGPGLSDTGDPLLALLEANYVATTSNVAFRRRLLSDERLRFLPLRYAHDWDFILGACRHGAFELIPEPLVRYRIHGANTIREGRDEAAGRGRMRCEVLWVMARHAGWVLRRCEARGIDRDELTARLWNSLPPFVSEGLFSQLLFLRGDEPRAPAAYDQLLAPDHPWGEAARRTLAAMPGE